MINIVRKGFAHIPAEAYKCPVCEEKQFRYRLECFKSANVNIMAYAVENGIQKYPTFTCGNCQTVWQYLGEKKEKEE